MDNKFYPEIERDGDMVIEKYSGASLPYINDEGTGSKILNVDDSLIDGGTTKAMDGSVKNELSTLSYTTTMPNVGTGIYIPPIGGRQEPDTLHECRSSPIPYVSSGGNVVFRETESSVKMGGRGVRLHGQGSDPGQVINGNRDYITRDIKNGKSDSIRISEEVTVEPGYSITNKRETISPKRYGYATLRGNLGAGHVINRSIVSTFSVGDIFDYGGYEQFEVTVRLNYACYFIQAGQNLKRGTGIIYLEGDRGERYDLVYPSGNIGTRTKAVNLNRQVSGAKSLTKKLTIPSGTYSVVVESRDLYFDTDHDPQGYDYYTWAGVEVTGDTQIKNYDGTHGVYEIINLATGKVISKSTLPQGTSYIDYTVPPNGHYRIRYTLIKGGSTLGGVFNSGGTIKASNGIVTDCYYKYSPRDPGEMYPYKPGDPYVPGFGGNVDVIGGGSGEKVPAPANYCWLDMFKLYSAPIVEREPECFGDYVDVFIDRDGRHYERHMYEEGVDTFIDFSLQNDTDKEEVYDIAFEYSHRCDGDPPLYLYGGRYTFNEPREPEVSSLVIDGFYMEEEKDVWYGAEGSSFKYNVYDKLGNLVFSKVWDSEGTFHFDLEGLDGLGYRAEFITHQTGALSDVTGIDYRAQFEILRHTVSEIWKPVPLPFDSALEFYIDDELVGRWDTEGGGIVKFDVPKGKHTYKWVLINNNAEKTWDFAEVDWLRLTNWICDNVVITPYCEEGGGDKAIEALIKCLLEIWRTRPEGCVFGNKKIWLFT